MTYILSLNKRSLTPTTFYKGMWVSNRRDWGTPVYIESPEVIEGTVMVSGVKNPVKVSDLSPVLIVQSRLLAFGFSSIEGEGDQVMYHEPKDKEDFYGEYDFPECLLILEGKKGRVEMRAPFVDQLQTALILLGYETQAFPKTLLNMYTKEIKKIRREKNPVYNNTTNDPD